MICKVHPTTRHEGPRNEYRSTLPLTSVLDGSEWSMSRSKHSTPGNETWYPLYRRLVGPRPVWTGAENLAPSVIRSPDHSARSKSLYCLHYPSPLICRVLFQYKQNIKLFSTHFSAGKCPPRHMFQNLEHMA